VRFVKSLSIAAGVCSLLAGVSVQAAEDPGMAMVRKYVGSWEIESLLKEPGVQAALKKLPAAARTRLINNLSTNGGVEYVGGALMVSGNAPHAGGEEMAVLCVSPFGAPLRVHAAIYSRGAISIYSPETRYDYTTTCIRDWVAVVSAPNLSYRMNKPANVSFTTIK